MKGDIRGAVEYLKQVNPESFVEIKTNTGKSLLVESLEIGGQSYQQIFDTQTGNFMAYHTIPIEKQ